MTDIDNLANPILNSPYEPPQQHFVIGHNGPTGEIKAGRRSSESFIPIPMQKKGKGQTQLELNFDVTGERRELNTLINDIRREVETWRARQYPGVTPYTRKLLLHWASGPPVRDEPVFFCQREAAETAIYLAEVAGRHGTDFRRRLEPENAVHNDGLPRIGLKMATGSGKTVVMGMLIAWQTINKVHNPRDKRFAKRFLIVTPGITIRDRLRVLLPADPGNYYRERDLVPPDLWGDLLKAEVIITNYHAFLPRTAKELKGVAANTKKLLLAGKSEDPFVESPDQIVSRVLGDFSGGGKGEMVVINDEAHHCYQDKLLDATNGAEKPDSEDKARNADARVWFKGLKAVHKKLGVKAVYDLSATPFYLKGSGYNEGYIFPWVVSDFSLMDAIESGIVKVPRIPVDDDAASDFVSYLDLWQHVGDKLRKPRGVKAASDAGWDPPDVLAGAMYSLYRSYERAFQRWQDTLAALGEPPPVFIVVCPNTFVSKLVFDWIAGSEVEGPNGEIRRRRGKLDLLSNVDEYGGWIERPPTIIVDSAQLESGESMSDDFKKAAAHEIDTFKRELVARGDSALAENLTDEDLLREVMNTVGKKGRLGEHVRCVVSVQMLTEGWDANTVTHILGIRAFRSQLLCEQVMGRGLRRRSYAVNDEGRFEPEYAEVYGVPFAFIPSDKKPPETTPKPPALWVEAIDERYDLRITFPKLDGYRIEMPDGLLIPDFDTDSHLHLRRSDVALWVKAAGIVGAHDEVDLDQFRDARPQEVAFTIASTIMRRHLQPDPDDRRPWLFTQLLDATRLWMDQCLTAEPGAPLGMLLLAEGANRAAERIFRGLPDHTGNQDVVLQPILRRFDPEGSTDDVAFATRKPVVEATKSHVSHVVLDGKDGNTWEAKVADLLEANDRVAAFVKNDHLGFAIPYVHLGRSHNYVPDFLAKLVTEPCVPERTLIVEVSGGLKSSTSEGADLTKAKSDTARYQWCPAVNNHGGFGRWGYTEITDLDSGPGVLDAAIESLYVDGPITGLPTMSLSEQG